MRFLWIAAMAALLALPAPSARAEIWTIACDDNFAPYNFFEGKALVGIDIELVTALVRQAGAEPRFEPMAWNRVRDKLERGDVDAAFQFVGLPERFQKYHMIGPYRTGRTVFAVQRNTPVSFDRYDDLQRYIIGLVNGFSYGVPFDTDPSLRKDATAGDNRQLLRMLAAGRVDLIIGDREALMHFARNAGLHAQMQVLQPAFSEVPRYIAVPRSKPEIAARLDKALTDLRRNGGLADILRRWE